MTQRKPVEDFLLFLIGGSLFGAGSFLFTHQVMVGSALRFGIGRGGGFGWQDMTVYSVGAAWDYGQDWTFRVGASTTDQPIPEDQMTFNILAPGVMEEHYTVGLTRKMGGGNEFNVAFMYAPKVKVSGPQNFDPTQTVELKMQQIELEISYSWKR